MPAATAALATSVHGGSDRLDQNRIRSLCPVLDDLQELLALIYGVVVGVDDIDFDTQPECSFDRRCRLFRLVIIVFRGQSNNYILTFHEKSECVLASELLTAGP